ncbi:MAG: hypothetical protein K2O56_07190 [Muribaculaceae bacterium]|nr:hypothetical protein [Muribaculaceae bacterium]
MNHIKDLLEKFYEGVSTPEEENILCEFFNSGNDIPDEMENDRRMFAILSDTAKYAVPPVDLQDRIIQAIDSSTANKNAARKNAARHSRFSWIAIATLASAAAVIALIVLTPFTTEITPDIPETPGQLAYIESADTIDRTIGNPDEAEKTPAYNSRKTTVASAGKRLTTKSPAISTERQVIARAETDNDEYPEFSEEEQKAFEAGMKAIARAGDQMAFASRCIESTDDNLRNIYTEIQDKLK